MHLLLAISRQVPESVSPALANRGDWKRQRTWYQWVSGSVGAVDSHTVMLWQRHSRAGAAATEPQNPSPHTYTQGTHMEPMKATSNQKASPCTSPECSMWNLNGISILQGEGREGCMV